MAYLSAKRKSKRRRRFTKITKNRCRFTRAGIEKIDYKNTDVLAKLLTVQGKMFSRKRSGSTAYWQRQTKIAIKRARFMGLLPYTN
ncbi:30S ribosomal protein S18 [Planctomycetota bacterium]